MFLNNLKQKLSRLIDPFWPKCPSGLGHRVLGEVVTNIRGHKYCCRTECVEANMKDCMQYADDNDITMGVGSGDGNHFVHGDAESISVLQLKLLELERLRREISQHEHNYNQAYVLGLKSGNQMDLQVLIDTLLEVRLQLLEKAAQSGILEARVHPYLDWYERVRDNRMAAPSDTATYKVCKAIAKLESQIILAQQELVKKKNEAQPTA